MEVLQTNIINSLIKDYVNYIKLEQQGIVVGSQAEGVWQEIIDMTSKEELPQVLEKIKNNLASD